MTDIDIPATDRILTTTRAVRRRLDLDRPVDEQVLLDCVDIAQQAPTGGNRQGWSFVVVRDAEKRRRLGELYRSVAREAFETSRAAAPTEQTARAYDSALYLADHLEHVPVHVIPCIAGRPEGLPPAKLAGMYGSIIPAIWSFMLALRARGLGSAWTTMHLHHEAAAAELLELPADVTQVALIPVAYYTGNTFSKAARPPANSLVHWDHWTGGQAPRE